MVQVKLVLAGIQSLVSDYTLTRLTQHLLGSTPPLAHCARCKEAMERWRDADVVYAGNERDRNKYNALVEGVSTAKGVFILDVMAWAVAHHEAPDVRREVADLGSTKHTFTQLVWRIGPSTYVGPDQMSGQTIIAWAVHEI